MSRRSLDRLARLYRRTAYVLSGGFVAEPHVRPEVTLRDALASGRLEDSAEEVFFGYFDKSPWSADMERLLLHRRGSSADIDILIADTSGDHRRVATSSAWNWQQGAMTQWLAGGRDGRIVFNDHRDGRLVSRILSIETGDAVTIPLPIQAVHPNGDEAMAINYRRLDAMKPEYGYGLEAANFAADMPLRADGIWLVDLRSGEADLRISLAWLADSAPRASMERAHHKVNHLLYSPSGRNCLFMHRWDCGKDRFSRLYVVHSDLTSHPEMLLDCDLVSHYSWLDERRIVTWARADRRRDGYFEVDIESGRVESLAGGVLDTFGDGHPTLSPDGERIVTDTYPDCRRQQRLLLLCQHSSRVLELGRFPSPWKFQGAVRCDLHPRWSPDGQKISIDSTHTGVRRSYVLDLLS